jgi:RNA polymerase sigma factor (sigma-70 family)
LAANDHTYKKELPGAIYLKDDFDKVFNLFFESLCIFAAGFTEERDPAKDIVMDMFLRILNKKESLSFESVNQLENFLFRSTKHSAIDYLRKNKRTEKNLKDYGLYSAGMQEEAGWNVLEKKARIRAMALDSIFEAVTEQLSADHLSVLQLSLNGKSTSEIAIELNKHEGTIRKYRLTAIRAIQKYLGNQYKEEIPSFMLLLFILSLVALDIDKYTH